MAARISRGRRSRAGIPREVPARPPRTFRPSATSGRAPSPRRNQVCRAIAIVFLSMSGVSGCASRTPTRESGGASEAAFSEGESSPNSKAPSPALGSVDEPAANLDPAVQLAARHTHFCARLRSGRVMCWGSNTRGELGDGTTLASAEPVEVQSLEDAVALMEGALCARSRSRGLVCWGPAFEGCDRCVGVPDTNALAVPGIATGFRTLDVATPCTINRERRLECLDEPPSSSPPWSGALLDVFEGQAFVCVGDGEHLACAWRGEHDWWEPPLPASRAVALGPDHLCTVDQASHVHCWGGRSRSRYAPPVSGQPAGAFGPPAKNEIEVAREVAAGSHHTCVVTQNGSVTCWGATRPGDPMQYWRPRVREAVDIAVARDSACASLEDGTVYCWDFRPGVATPEGRRVPGIARLGSAPPKRVSAADLLGALRWASTPRRLASLSTWSAVS